MNPCGKSCCLEIKENRVKPALLIVDDEESVRESFRMVLQDDYDLLFAEDAKTTLRLLKTQTFDLCLLDIMLPDGSGLNLLRQMKRRDERIDVIMVTALQGVETALDAMKGEALDYITKPFEIGELRGLIKGVLAKRTREQEYRSFKAEINEQKPLCLTGISKAINKLLKKIETATKTESPICVIGEKGMEIEELAREIHRGSGRKIGPFVTVSLSTLSEEQLKRELFGEEAEKGKVPQVSKLEFADKGTLFLKQVDRMPLTIQKSLMAIFAGKTMFQPKGGVRMPLDIRIIASSEMDLTTAYARRFFLKDFHRFLTGRIFSVPPLRERKADIPLLMDRVLKMANRKAKTPVKTIRKEVVQLLTQYPWFGNLSELEKCIETMVLFAGKDTLTMDDIPLDILIMLMGLADTDLELKLSVKQLQRQFERIYIRKVIEHNLGHQDRTAESLGLHRTTLFNKLKKLNLEEDRRSIVQKRRDRGMGFRDLKYR